MIKKILAVAGLVCLATLGFTQDHKGQNPGIVDLYVTPTPIGELNQPLEFFIKFGNSGNGTIQLQEKGAIQLILELSKTAPQFPSEATLGIKNDFADKFEISYNETQKTITAVLKAGATLSMFEVGDFSIPLVYTGTNSMAALTDIGVQAQLIISPQIDNVSDRDDKLFVYTFFDQKKIKGEKNKAPILPSNDFVAIKKTFNLRQNKVVDKGISVYSDSISVDFYDNAQIDGDSISIFYNKELLAANKLLQSSPLHFDIVLDSSKTIHEISMFANNLGSIPPNTALMIVTDGNTRHKLYMSSSLKENATIFLKREPKSRD